MTSTLTAFVVITFVYLNGVVHAADVCYNSWYNEYYECQYGCCGSGYDAGCCSIAGIVVGALFAAGILIACIAFCVCFHMKQRARRGGVVHASRNTQTVTVVQANPDAPYGQPSQHQSYPYPAHQYPPPPPYPHPQQYPPPQGGGGYPDPAYPPQAGGSHPAPGTFNPGGGGPYQAYGAPPPYSNKPVQ